MKNLIVIFILTLVSCGPSPKQNVSWSNDDTRVKRTNLDGKSYGVSILEVDGCEYVMYSFANGAGLTHKGNCKNHEPKRN